MNHFDYRNGVLHAEAVNLSELAATVGTPFYCYSTATLERHYRVFADAFAGEKVLVCYAMKANSNQSVLRTLAKLGAGADVVSGGELKRALAAGIPASKILFSGVGKTETELRAALAADILCLNVESEPELELLSRLATEMGKTARISVRVNPDVDAGTHAKISTGKSENKFGIPIAYAREVYARAAKLPGIQVTGTDVHIGSQITDLSKMETAFRILSEFVQTLRSDGHNISHVDFGGGLGIPYYMDREAPPAPDAYAAMVKRVSHNLGCTLMFEPGRMIVGNAGHPGRQGDLREARRRQEFRHHRRRHERFDPPDAVRGASRHSAGDAAGRGRRHDHGRRRRPGLRDRRLSRTGSHAADAEAWRSHRHHDRGRLWRGAGRHLQHAAAGSGSAGKGRSIRRRAPAHRGRAADRDGHAGAVAVRD
ncbi:diaminopimelate decarboxylase [Bradyrhizobium sp. i1.3.1]